MKFGLSLCPEVGRFDDTIEQAGLAEDLGYDSVWLPEHHLMDGYEPSPFLGLAGVAAVTSRVELGTNIAVVPFYDPVRLAENAAQLADMSGNRFILGVGLGYRPEEFEAFGVPYNERGGRMHEGLELCRSLLTSRDASYAGRYFKVDGLTIHPRPSDGVPIYVGGWSRRALRRAAELGDAWFPGPTADLTKLRSCLKMYDDELATLGRQREELPLFREACVASDRDGLAGNVDRLRALYADDYLTWGHHNVAGAGDRSFDELAADRFLIGTPDKVAAEIQRYRRTLGVTHLVVRMHFHGSGQQAVLRSMRLFAQEVIPAVRSA